MLARAQAMESWVQFTGHLLMRPDISRPERPGMPQMACAACRRDFTMELTDVRPQFGIVYKPDHRCRECLLASTQTEPRGSKPKICRGSRPPSEPGSCAEPAAASLRSVPWTSRTAGPRWLPALYRAPDSRVILFSHQPLVLDVNSKTGPAEAIRRSRDAGPCLAVPTTGSRVTPASFRLRRDWRACSGEIVLGSARTPRVATWQDPRSSKAGWTMAGALR